MPRLGGILSIRRVLVAALAAGALLTGAAPGSADLAAVVWQAPTPAPGSVLTVQAGSKLRVQLNVAVPALPGAVLSVKGHRPHGSTLTVKAGNPSTAVFSWRPSGRQIGDHAVSFTASVKAPVQLSASALPLTIRVVPGYAALTTETGSHYAYLIHPTAVHSGPSKGSSRVGRVGLWTPENYPNLVSLIEHKIQKNGTWVHVRFAKLPNNTTGWVPREAIGSYRAVQTHLVVNRAATTMTLYKAGRVVFRTRVGVGQNRWPTPRGEFYVTEKLRGFHNAAYGPLAFGTSARSAVLTDWPGGGFIGIHGTNEPGLIPGHVSHGCVRLRNVAILRLARLLPVGTPLTIQ
jgi:lipoprotein-anchoring transpeptidase ErfK/SrfK